MNTAWTIWLIGIIFTTGYASRWKCEGWKDHLFLLCAIAFLWPFVIGVTLGKDEGEGSQ